MRLGVGLAINRWRRPSGAAVPALDTLITAVGGTASVKAVYDGRTNVNVIGGLVQTWDDARGSSGFGPSFTGFGATKPAYDATNKIITTSGANWLQTVVSAKFDVSGDLTYVVIAAVPAAAIYSGINTSPDPYNVGLAYFPVMGSDGTDTYVSNIPNGGVPADGATLRLAIADARQSAVIGAPGGAYAWAETWGRARKDLGGGASANVPGTAGNRALTIGGLPNSGALVNGGIVKVQFIMVIDHSLTQAEHDAVLAFVAAAAPLAPSLDHTHPAIFWDGNSIVYGLKTTAPATKAPPAIMKSANAALSTYDVRNYGVSGQSGTTMLTVTPLRLFSAYNASRPKNFYIYLEGNNDSGNPAATVQANIHDLCLAAKTKGFTVIVCTIPASSGIVGANETNRLANNAYIRGAVAGGWAHAVADIASNPHLQNPADLTYYDADGIHMNDVGSADLANNATWGVYPALVPFL